MPKPSTSFICSGRRPLSKNSGFTLLELMIVMVIVAIGIALAVPNYEDVLQRRQTTAQAEELAAFIAHAQSEAIKQNTEISIQLSYSNADNWCLGADESLSGCDCTGSDADNLCNIQGLSRTMSSSTHEFSSMVAHSADTLFVFDPIRGTLIASDLPNPHTFTMQSDKARYALQVNVAVTGQVRVCNSDSSKRVPGFKSCIMPPQDF